MFSKIETLVGCIYYNCILIKSVFFKKIQNLSDTFINCCNAGQVILKISLVFKAYKLISFKSGFIKLLDYRIINFIPGFQLVQDSSGRVRSDSFWT